MTTDKLLYQDGKPSNLVHFCLVKLGYVKRGVGGKHPTNERRLGAKPVSLGKLHRF